MAIRLAGGICEAAAGMTERPYPDFCRAHPELVTRIGKLRAIPVDDLLRFLRAPRVDVHEADVDAVLALVGRQRNVGS